MKKGEGQSQPMEKQLYSEKKQLENQLDQLKNEKSKFDHYLNHLANQFYDFSFFDVSPHRKQFYRLLNDSKEEAEGIFRREKRLIECRIEYPLIDKYSALEKESNN
ncbi:hypothetical protein V1268_000940 [Enterococcus hirae]|uniref:hypothetical protein n=1 Tax=Enterococcus TaxID=1350 RepID=UPI00159736C1|nr:hypothetical protein [Enterococcus hirae]EMF0260669.1 hypothetical protein [Enterococcus hirae]MDU1931645.1 hypothetical protein [Enterococcus hirae]QKX70320.1 hypothetical protein HU257_01120 [Enterococcus hirae]